MIPRWKIRAMPREDPSTMPHLAFVTYTPNPALQASDQLIADALAELGTTVTAAPWDDHSIDWTAFDSVIIRSTWNYFDHPTAFSAWLDRIEALGVHLINPYPLIRWNMVKTYLQPLEAAGVPVVPTEWVAAGTAPDLAALVKRRGWGDVLLKPATSGGAKGIIKVAAGKAHEHQAALEDLAQAGVVMVQPMLREIHDGEISILFAGGEFTHAVRKFPAENDIFVQRAHGGHEVAYHPPYALIDEAAAVLDAARKLSGVHHITYARVDGLILDGQFTLMELEVLEPALFVNHAPQVADRYAAAFLMATQARQTT